MFGLYYADVLKIRRTVEIYQWREEKVSGGEGEEDRYNYKQEWLSHAVDQNMFKHEQDGPANPSDDEWPCKSETFINP